MSERQLSAVIEACWNIKNSGSTPTTALIRSKLAQSVSLPDIIRGLKYWKANPTQTSTFKDTKTAPKPLPDTLNKQQVLALFARIETLENTVKSLQIEVKALKQQ